MLKVLEEFDLKISRYINSHFRTKLLDKIMKIFTILGNLGLIWIMLSILFISNESSRTLGIMIISALILTTIIGEGIIKHIVKRKRPFVKMNTEEQLLIGTPSSYSFPSGHTASSFTVSAVFIGTDNSISLLIFILATLIAISRLYLNVHYLSDIIGGAIIGTICGKLIVLFFTMSI